MDSLVNFIIEYRQFAPLITFFLILLAGFNIPISIDIILVLSAVLAATTIPEYAVHLFLSFFLGSCLSAWIAYWVGRKLGIKLVKYKWFSKILCEEKLVRVGSFYKKHGFFTLLIGRFIPFGVRNCIFMTSGMSKVHFGRFILRDFIACFIWSLIAFYTCYSIGVNYQLLLHYLKTFNILIFSAFGVTLIGVIWYKRRNRKKRESSPKNDAYERE